MPTAAPSAAARSGPPTKKEYERALLSYAKPLHAKPVREIRRGEIARLIRDVANMKGSTSAIRTRAALSCFRGWKVASDLVDANVVIGTEGYSTPKRQRVLSDGELRAVWAATADRSDVNMLARIMIWTGCRRAEAGGMSRHELDANGVWTVPASVPRTIGRSCCRCHARRPPPWARGRESRAVSSFLGVLCGRRARRRRESEDISVGLAPNPGWSRWR